MPVLSEAASRAAHSEPNSAAWTMMVSGPEATAKARMTYVDLDGIVTVQFLDGIEDAVIYARTIEAFWQAVDEANQQDKATKDTLYREILTLLKTQVDKHGNHFLPPDLKRAVNEIEDYFNIETTTW